MPDNHDEKLTADNEIERLIQPYSDSAVNLILNTYKKNPDERYAVYTWQNTLLSSAHLYQKALDEGIGIRILRLDFTSKLEAIFFVCMRQLERSDLTESYYKYLIGEAHLTDHLHSSMDKSVSKLQSAMKLATPLHLAAGTVLKYGEYAKAMDIIYLEEPQLADYILNDQVKVSHKNTIELARIPKENLKLLLNSIETNGLTKITYADMRFETQYNPPKGLKPCKVIRTEEKDEQLAIRQLPKFDPDAQISSLALTIPSWTSSINRVTEATDFC